MPAATSLTLSGWAAHRVRYSQYRLRLASKMEVNRMDQSLRSTRRMRPTSLLLTSNCFAAYSVVVESPQLSSPKQRARSSTLKRIQFRSKNALVSRSKS